MITGKIHSSKSPLKFEDLLIIAEQSKSAGNLEGHINWLNIALGTNHILCHYFFFAQFVGQNGPEFWQFFKSCSKNNPRLLFFCENRYKTVKKIHQFVKKN